MMMEMYVERLTDLHDSGLNKMIFIYIDGLAQDCSNSIANALELLQPGAKPSI